MSKNIYEKQYQQSRDVCGPPFPEFRAFFDDNHAGNLRVLDLGCGQGRDALFIAQLGHRVTGVDLSPTGIGQMVADAKEQGSNVKGVVADIVEYQPEGLFDVIILDRVLHMLGDDDTRFLVLSRAIQHLNPAGTLLIADTLKNMTQIHLFFASRSETWQFIKKKKGILIVQRKV